MRRKTYAYNSILIGILVAMLVYVSTQSVVLTVLAGLGVAVGGFFLIRLLENALYHGVDKAAEKVGQAYQNHKAQKAAQAGSVTAQAAQFPGVVPPAVPAQPVTPSQTAAPVQSAPQPAPENAKAEFKFCPYCGVQIKRSARFCPACGQALEN